MKSSHHPSTSGRRTWNRLQEQCPQQNSELVLLDMSEFANPKRKSFYSKTGEDKRVMGFLYHESFFRCCEEELASWRQNMRNETSQEVLQVLYM